MLNHVRLFVTPQTVTCQAPLSMGFSRQEYWSRLSCPSPRDLPNPEMEPISHASPALAGGFFTTAPPENPTCFRLVVTSISSVQSLRLFVTPWIAACQASLSITNSRSSLKLTSIELVMPSSRLILCHPLLLPSPVPPRIRVFSMSQLFAWAGQSIGVSALASALPMNTQNWSSLEWTGWISLQSKGLSRVFSNTTVQKHQVFGTQQSQTYSTPPHIYILFLLFPPFYDLKSSFTSSYLSFRCLLWLSML